jgi:hypothetical protein
MNVGRTRLANQHISKQRFTDPADVVRWHGAVQAQDYLAGLWAVGLRAKGATEASVEEAVARRAIVRTWPMRGTLHFVAAPDIRWMTRLLTPRVIAGAKSRYRQLGMDDSTFASAARVAERALAGGKVVRRDALYRIWNDAGIATHDARGLHLLGFLSQTGLLCFGPRDGKQQTFTLLEEWLPEARLLERDVALGELARRYFASHGPATIHDFEWWSGLTLADERAGLQDVASELVSEDVGGRTFWFADSPAVRTGARTAYLLPAWDEFTVAYRDRTDILDARYSKRVNAGGGVLSPVIVIDGIVVGTWQRTIVKGKVVITPTLFGRLERRDREAFALAADRYARFLGVRAGIVGA